MDVSIKMILQIRGGQNAQKTEDILSIVDVLGQNNIKKRYFDIFRIL